MRTDDTNGRREMLSFILAGWEPLLKWAESHPAHRATLKVAKG